ncbi:MAG: hypothetical protein ACPL4H_10345 [Anaerolineales bacterium]
MNKKWLIFLVAVVILACLCLIVVGVGGGFYYLSQRRAHAINPTATAEAILAQLEATPTFNVPTPTFNAGECAQGSTGTACVTPTQSPPPEQPTPTSEKAANIDFNGMSFYLDTRLAQGVLPEIVPAAPGDPSQTMAGEVHPEYTQFTLQGYILKDTFHTPRIYIYPLNDYRTMDSAVDDIANRLAQLLAEQPSQVESLPFLPLWNAAQMFHAQVQYLEFKNGKGVRFLTQYGQALYPVNNHDLFYTFQGISSDNMWYVAMVLPTSHPLLPASYAGGDAGISDPVSYFNQVSTQLSALDPTSFNPSLLMLDELVHSLQTR